MPISVFWSNGGSEPPRDSGNSGPASPQPPPDTTEPALRKWPLAARVAILAGGAAIAWFGVYLAARFMLGSSR
jgi:hypothetical protein